MSESIHFIPEVATILIAQVGVTPPSDDPVAMRKFQQTIYQVQHRFEESAQMHAARTGKLAIVQDRGILDNAAYLPNGAKDLEHICNTTEYAELERYDMVICLGLPSKKVFDKNRHNNPARSENYREAKLLEERICKAWRSHPVRIDVGGKSFPMNLKIEVVRSEINKLLSSRL